MVNRVNKYIYLHVVQGRYSDLYGWEDVAASESWKEARDDLRTYNLEEPGYLHRLIHRREPNLKYGAESRQSGGE